MPCQRRAEAGTGAGDKNAQRFFLNRYAFI
jgi:hypothetical protein